MSKLLQCLVILPLIFLSACATKKKEEEAAARQYYFDPRVPFGSLDPNNTSVMNVQNLQADISVLEKIKLTWKVPPIYTTLNYKVFIYKRKNPPSDFNIVCPRPASAITSLCPADETSAAPIYLYKELQANEYLDQNEVVEGEEVRNVDPDVDYSYWVFLRINDDDWSTGVRLDVRSKAEGSSFQLPDFSKFWEYKRWGYGYDSQNGLQFLQSMNPGAASPGDPRGGLAFAYTGNLMYFADTANNRVVIYTRAGAMNCDQFTDPFEREGCLLQYYGAPLTAQNVLGQPTGSSLFACGEVGALPTKECLTAPTRVAVIGSKLFISDSGNNRVVVYNHLPTNGCVTDNGSGILTPRDCTPDWVIGKAGLEDTTTYSVGSSGNSSLSYPTDVVANGSDLYIADTNNNRVIKIRNYANNDLFSCTPDTWSTPFCQFSDVLGQPTLFSKTTFEDFVVADANVIVQTGLKDTIRESDKDLLKRYFRHPVRIKFTSDNKLLIAANEQFERQNSIGGRSSIQARIMIFNENPIGSQPASCNPATFNIGECDADDAIGQADFGKLETVASSQSSAYNQLQHGLYSVDDFDVVTLPGAESTDPDTQLLMAVNSQDNLIYVYNDWPNKVAPGFPKSGTIVDPEGAPNPQQSGALQPDLSSICAIRMSLDTSNIYITDCGANRVYEINVSRTIQ